MRFEEQVLDWHTLWLISAILAFALLSVAPLDRAHATRVKVRLRIDHLRDEKIVRQAGFVNGLSVSN